MAGETTFDVVIVGAGAAGCLIANRLSVDPGRRVLLLEAGPGDGHPMVKMPLGSYALFGTKRDWDYKTSPVPGCNGRRMTWSRGRMIGGSTGINTMVYIRGNPADFDDWEALGNPGWGWADCLPVYKSLEDQVRGPGPLWGSGGELFINEPSGLSPLSETFITACGQAGLPRNDDFNGDRQDGAGYYQVTARGGARISSASAFLDPVRDRPNLTVRTKAHVARVRMSGGRASAVEVVEGRGVEVISTGAVVLCAGTIASPAILQRSGIGPTVVLERLGARVLIPLPGVGRNMQDHLHVPVLHRCLDKYGTVDRFDLRTDLKMGGAIIEWLLFKKGLGTITGPEVGAFARTRPERDRPDIQFHFGPAYWTEPGPLKRSDGPHFMLAPGLSQQRSRGFVEAASLDPAETPLIQPNYLADDDDVQTLVDGSAWRDKSRRPRPSRPSTPESACQGQRSTTAAMLWRPTSDSTARRSTTPSAPVAWGRTPTRLWSRQI